MRTKDEVLFHYLMRFVGTPYYYGGNVPSDGGIDCSGLALIYLQAAGKWPHGQDASAQAIFDKFKIVRVLLGQSMFGDLCFYGKDEKSVFHVGIILGNFGLMLEAGGGDSTTTSVEKSAARDAMVRVRPVTFRKDFLAALRP